MPDHEERFKTNSQEASLCAMLVKNIIELYRTNEIPYDANQTIGIISPFRGQGALIRHELSLLGMEEYTQHISIDTVERYQGSQRDIIIYCTTATSPALLELITDTTETSAPASDRIIDRKLNVALTRARMQLFVIGIPEILEANSHYHALLNELPR
jgi:superfamily I DNA and/or RNA helicase